MQTQADPADFFDKQRGEYWQRVFSTPLPEKISANEFLESMLKIGKQRYSGFVIDENNSLAYRLLSKYFVGDPLFEIGGFSLSKGICLAGEIGTGKTVAMNLAHEVVNVHKLRFMKRVSVSEIIRKFARTGPESLDEWSATFCKHFLYNTDNETKPIDLIIDDLGSEICPFIYYGSSFNVLAEVLSARHSYFDKGILTHVTTNLSNHGKLTENEIYQKYGFRVQDRFTQMFNYIALYGKSRRK
jgi:hypothetical protein